MSSSREKGRSEKIRQAHEIDGSDVRPGGNSQHLRKKVVDHLDMALENVDESIAERLAYARRRALSQRVSDKRTAPALPLWATGMVSTCVLTIAFIMWFSAPDPTPMLEHSGENTAALESVSILSASDDLDFYQSVDFLIWMENSSG